MRYCLLRILQRLEIFLLKIGFVRDTGRQTQMQLIALYRQRLERRDLPIDFEEIGFNEYSPTYEDGILLYIFSLIGMSTKKLLDIGAGTVKGSSTANLIVNHGFTGLLIDGNPQNATLLNDYYATHPETRYGPPTTLSMMVHRENVNRILASHDVKGEIDLLCIDVDGIDYHLWQAINVIQPHVILVEYQDILGPEKSWTIPYSTDFNPKAYSANKASNNYCGASLQAFATLGRQKGYRLVGCNKGGWNAFFIRAGLGEEELPEVTVESCFKYEWNKYGMENYLPLVEKMEWIEV